MDKQLKRIKDEYVFYRIDNIFKKLYDNSEYRKIKDEFTKKTEEIESIVVFKLMNEYMELNSELLGYSDDEIYKVGFKDGVNMIFNILLNSEQ